MYRKPTCRHSFTECLVTYHYKEIISHEPFEITRHTEYCTKCGLISNKRFDDDFPVKTIAGTDYIGHVPISQDELKEKYKDLPSFDVSEDENIKKVAI